MDVEIEDKSLQRTRQFAWIAIMVGCVGISIILINAVFGFALTGAKGAVSAIQNSSLGKSTEIFRGASSPKASTPEVEGRSASASQARSSGSGTDLPATSVDHDTKITPGAIPSSRGTVMKDNEDGTATAINLPETPAGFERLINEMLAIRPAEFRPGSSILSWNGKTNLDQIIPLLKAKPDWRFEIGSHVAASDTADADKITTQRRAETIAGYLGSEGVSGIRMSTKGYGSSKPISDNGTDLGRLKNQRIEIKVLGTQ